MTSCVAQMITTRAEITANHKGYFVYRICEAPSATVEVTQECLDSHVLRNAAGQERY